MSNLYFFKPLNGAIVWETQAPIDWLTQNEGKKCYADLGRETGVRSLNQNSFYWMYIDLISKETGHTSNELHWLFKGLFLPKKQVEWKGKKYWMGGSTTNLNKIEMGEYMERICAECGVPIPDPKLADMAKYKI